MYCLHFFLFFSVRSIASVSIRKSKKTPFSFDFFTVSFNKDYSALYGGKNNTNNIICIYIGILYIILIVIFLNSLI